MDAELYELSGRIGRCAQGSQADDGCRGILHGAGSARPLPWCRAVRNGSIAASHLYKRAKQDMLGVSADTLNEFGAVVRTDVREMVAGALAEGRSQMRWQSRYRGPEGRFAPETVGTVLLAWAEKGGGVTARSIRFQGDRDAVRRQTVIAALEGLLALLDRKS